MKNLSMSLLAAGLLMSAPPAVVADDAIFPDKKLEAVVRQYVFEKRYNEEPIVEDDVVNISTIEGKGKGVSDLTGLEKCRSLALLDLENNKIEDISYIKELKNIQSLNLKKNRIKDITPLAGLTKLQYIQLENNQISDISPLRSLENVRSLYLSNNQIKNLEPLAKMTKMWSLYLANNRVEDISTLSKLKSLDSLDLSDNRVSNIRPLADLTEWKWLFLQNNQLTDITTLIEMGKKDREGSQRFAYFWNVYLSGNPLDDNARKSQLDELRKYAKTVKFETE